MKIGIVVYSKTGNTMSVAQKMKQELLTVGHSVNIEQVTAVSEEPKSVEEVQLKNIPDVSGYDVLIFGSPVHAFSLPFIMKAYLAQVTALKGIKVGCFVTQQFPFAWMGGNNAVNQMKKACQSKGGNVFDKGVVNWGHKQREAKISDVIKKMASAL
ncbi:MAG: Flavodoxin domain protein [Firmicutes bacterium ADurb.Bin419]|nr:MAG: Flavodoxin domain protein [Firmicutes bacterium ADurb.Bin419]